MTQVGSEKTTLSAEQREEVDDGRVHDRRGRRGKWTAAEAFDSTARWKSGESRAFRVRRLGALGWARLELEKGGAQEKMVMKGLFSTKLDTPRVSGED